MINSREFLGNNYTLFTPTVADIYASVIKIGNSLGEEACFTKKNLDEASAQTPTGGATRSKTFC